MGFIRGVAGMCPAQGVAEKTAERERGAAERPNEDFGAQGASPSWILKQVQDDRIFFVLWLLHEISLNWREAIEGNRRIS